MGPRGVVANNFSQYLLKITNASTLTSSYTPVTDSTGAAAWALIYSSTEMYYVTGLEIYASPNSSPPELGVRVTANSSIDLIRLTSPGLGAAIPVTAYAGTSNLAVLTFPGPTSYNDHVTNGAQILVSIRWS